MKIRSLLLGSVAAAGLSTGAASAADLGVLPSFDVCDELGMSGLTISSDTNCLAITGGVTYSFTWGDYADDGFGFIDVDTMAGTVEIDESDDNLDWQSTLDAWLTFVGAAPTDMGPAKAVITLTSTQDKLFENTTSGSTGTSNDFEIDEAYVQIGDSSSFTLIAGATDSIFNDGDDEPLNFFGLFNFEVVDVGIGGDAGGVDIATGGHVIQALVSVGDGFTIGGGLEALDDSSYFEAGTAVGVIAYSGDGISAHASFAADGVLYGTIDEWMVHAGFDGTFDDFRVVAAAYFDSAEYWNVLGSASVALDMFTLAGSVEVASDGSTTDYGAGVSIAAEIVDDVILSLGGRYYYDESNPNPDSYEIAAKIEAPVTETLSMAGTIGYITDGWQDEMYGSASLDWAPGGGFTNSSAITVNSQGAYKLETEFTKEFE